MRWVEIINVLIDEDGFILFIKDGNITGMKYFNVDFCKHINLNDYKQLQELCVKIMDYSTTLKYEDPSLAQLVYDCVNVLLDNKSVGSWVQDDFCFGRNELC